MSAKQYSPLKSTQKRFFLLPVKTYCMRYSYRHIQSTVASATLKLTVQDISEIEAILIKAKGPSGSIYELEREFKGPHGRVMKYNLNQINQGAHLEELCHR